MLDRRQLSRTSTVFNLFLTWDFVQQIIRPVAERPL